jgi:protein involved in polysaccharide export with SLBB domain
MNYLLVVVSCFNIVGCSYYLNKMMKLAFQTKFLIFGLCIFAFYLPNVFSQEATQTPTSVKRNNPLSPNPKKKETVIVPKTETEEIPVESVEIAENTTATKILKVITDASVKSRPLTETYKVGVKDVLLISFKTAKLQNTTYVTVLEDGTIDYPLAGGNVNVENATLEEIQDFLREKVILKDKEKETENLELIVKVREAASHNIKVIGLVEKSGDKTIQRDAVPLFVVKAEAIVDLRATQVVIHRIDGKVEKFDLKDLNTDDTLIYPNDIIEFVAKAENVVVVSKYYFVAGSVVSPGQKDFHDGITLTQAIFAAGGLKKVKIGKIFIRRKNELGMLSSTEFDYKAVTDGKIVDPILQPGDLIEVVN